jgi:Mn2+/Fe2+ NRAMP family transporter
MATTAYVVGAQFDWRRGLSERLGHARAFYGALAASVALGFAASLAKVSVIGVLVAASVVGGFGTPLSLILLVLLARDSTVMGSRLISRRLAITGWAVAVLIGGFGLLFLVAAALGKL